MNEAYVEISGVHTKVMTWGRWLEESKGDTDELIVIIPGNPGVPGFYKKFAETLYEQTKIPVWCVGHSGHNFGDKSMMKLPEFDKNKNLYGLNGQIEHKIEFFRKYVPVDAQVHLVAHSIGSYMSVEILEHPDVKNKIKDVYLLFPTLEHMAKTPNGNFMNTWVLPVVQITLFLTWIFTILPKFLASFLLYIYMFIHNIPRQLHADNIRELLKPGVLRRVFYLAFDEMDHVKQRNNTILARNKDKIKIYYSKTDGWTPQEFYHSLKKEISGVDAEQTDINHAFVFNDSVKVGCTVSQWIEAKN